MTENTTPRSNNNASIHDNFIRSILSNKKMAAAYFKSCLPEFISCQLDFTSLEQLSGTYLSEELKKTMSDILYSCRRKGGKSTVKVSLLVEHKSYPDKYTPIQMGSYIFSALQKQAAGKEPLSLVIPVLLYHGKGKWQYRRLADLFEGIEEEWKQYLPDFEYVYNNLGTLTDTEVERLNNKFLKASFLALKHSFEKEWLGRNAVNLLVLASAGPKALQKGFIIYLYSRGDLKEENVLNSLPEPIKKTIMSTLDIYIEKGRKKGIEEGIEKGVEKKSREFIQNLLITERFSVPEIAGFAGVTEPFVKKVRASLKKKK
ncbi:MAG: Rpn family recombination-promoting nuclease/putative transposase [Chitinophagaceae bacterium]|nr:Rpn family recombination-promoting nuclease/putative transposase [Chitinophagaceae bacterium]